MSSSAIEKFLEFAVRREEAAANMFDRLAKMTKNADSKVLFTEFAAEEREHAKIVAQFNDLPKTVQAGAKFGNLDYERYRKTPKLGPDNAYQDILLAGIRREEESVEIYQHMMERNSNPELRKIFAALVGEEDKHRIKLKDEYDDFIASEF